MLFHVTERYRNGDPAPIYRRFRKYGRMTPDGVEYVASWVTDDLARCFQVMEAESREALDAWIGRWGPGRFRGRARHDLRRGGGVSQSAKPEVGLEPTAA